MKTPSTLTLLIGILVALSVTSFASAQVVYSENFESIDIVSGAGMVSFGYDSTPSGSATKAINYGQWGRQGANSTLSDVDSDTDNELLPNIDGANNAKVWATIIDPSLFAATGAGTYTFSVDTIGADAGASRIYLWSANGFDATGSNDLLLDLAEAGFGAYTSLSGTGATQVNEIFMYEISDETVGGNYSTNFNYTAGDAIVVVFGSYNTAFAYDNLQIATYAGSDTDGDGLDDSVETNTGVFIDATNTGTDPNDEDSDGDTLSDGDEVNNYKTDPTKVDTDGDTLSDNVEISTYKTDPKIPDTNNDGLSDQVLVAAGFNAAVDYSAVLSDSVLNPLGFSTSLQPPVAGANEVVVAVSDGSSTVQMQMERSSDLINWNASPSDLMDMDLNVAGDKDYVRFSMQADD